MSKNISDDEYLKILEEAIEEAWEIANSKNEGTYLKYVNM